MENEDVNKKTLEDKFIERQQYWNNTIKELNTMMKDITSISSLQNKIYSVRQDAVDYYYILLRFIGKYTILYNKKYAEKYKEYKMNSQIRYNSEAAIKLQIDSDFSDIKQKISFIDNQANYMQDTIKTIDSMIYGVKYKIDIQKLITKVDF